MESEDVKKELQLLERSLRRFADSLATTSSSPVRQTFERVGSEVKDQWGAVRERAVEEKDRLDKVAHEHPWETAGIAAAVGALVGVLVSSMWQRK